MMLKNKENIAALNYCLSLIEDKLGWGSSKHWRNSDFNDLSDIIYKKTNYLISNSTLKRIWGKTNYHNFPSRTSLNAFALFLGYANWKEFIRLNWEETHRHMKPYPFLPIFSSAISFFKKKTALILFFIFLCLLIISSASILFLNHKQKKFQENLQLVEFYCDPCTGNIPFLSQIHYDISAISSDNNDISILSGGQWGIPDRKIILDKDIGIISSNVLYPGTKKVSLLVNQKPVKTIILRGYNEQWSGFFKLMERSIHQFLPSDSVYHTEKGVMQFNTKTVTQLSQKNPIRNVNYVLCRDFNVSGDNMIFKTRFKHIPVSSQDMCQQTYITIDCDSGFFSIPVLNPVCIINAVLTLNEKRYSGLYEESLLTGFSYDDNDWHTLFIRVIDKKNHNPSE